MAVSKRTHWAHWTKRLATGYQVVDGCHVWLRSRNNRGYAVIYFDGKLHLAHRAAWFAAYGVWPDPDKVLDHICENKSCVNVDHLRELTNKENILRSPNSPMNVSIRATHCRNGHAYGEDTPRDKHGWRCCQSCRTRLKGVAS